MREILFRGKRTKNNEWIYGSFLMLNDVPYIHTGKTTSRFDGHPETGSVITTELRYEVDPSTIGQYTGVVDKLGEKIFEGDILKEGQYRFKVVYEPNWAKFELIHGKDAYQYPEWNRGKLMRVVGNIHDDPELI